MARRKKITTVDNEHLSKETEQVQEAVLKDLMNEDAINEIAPEKKSGVKKAEQVEKVQKRETPKPKKDELKVGDRVKLNKDVETDTLGRRIHNGIRNYTYNVLAVRPDDFISIECLTYAFLVRKDQVNKV